MQLEVTWSNAAQSKSKVDGPVKQENNSALAARL